MKTEAKPYETLVGNFQLICRHCKRASVDHAANKCLFDSTDWTPMSEDEWKEWCKSELGKLGADFIREELKKSSMMEWLRTGKIK